MVVQASQPGDGTNYNAAVPVMQSIQVSLALSSVTWSALPVADLRRRAVDAGRSVDFRRCGRLHQLEHQRGGGGGESGYHRRGRNDGHLAQDAGDSFYAPGANQQVLTVNPATPALTLPTASSITFGQTLASSTLADGSAALGSNAVSGGFAFVDASTAPNAGAYAAPVVFTPADTTDYTSVLTNVNVVVAALAPSLLALPAAAPIIFGQSLAASVLINGSASVSGSFAFADSSATPGGAGTYAAAVVFTPADTNYATVSTNVNVEVDRAVPSVSSWPTTTPINFGNPLSASSLVGGNSAPAGTFAFNDPTAILRCGHQLCPGCFHAE